MALNNYKLKYLKEQNLKLKKLQNIMNLKLKDLGKDFYIEFKNYSKTLGNLPFFEVKYNIVRTLPLKKFPYTIHFSINENKKIVSIQAVTSNHQYPNTTRIKL